MSDLPFMAEYAKSGRAGCRGCKGGIAKDDLRMAIMVQSPHFDGKMPMWYHFDCFWSQGKAKQLKSEADICHFDNLRWDDQESIRSRIQGKSGSASATPKKAAKVTDFEVEQARNGMSKCRECGNKILKSEVRLGRHDGSGKAAMWYHVGCFATKREEFGFTFKPENIPGYHALTDADKQLLSDKLKPLKRAHDDNGTEAEDGAPSTSKKRKVESKNGNGSSAVDDEKLALKMQSDDLWKLRDKLTKTLSKKDYVALLTHNNQEIPSGEAKILDRLTDCMLFGALEKCIECKGGQLVYSSTNNTYCCTGHISGFTGCQYTTRAPKRVPFEIPDDYEDHEFLVTYVFKPGRERVFPSIRPSLGGESGLSASASATSAPSQSLASLKFVVMPGVSNQTKETIREIGGIIVAKVDSKVIAVVAPHHADEFKGEKQEGKDAVAAKKANVHIVSEEFVPEAAKHGNVAELIQKYKMCDWGSDINEKIQKAREPATSRKSASGKQASAFKSMQTTQKLVLKGGAAVDPDFEFAAIAHVYQDKAKNVYTAALSKADAQTGTNSYYKLQLLEHDSAKKYWVFRSWGRVGTTIGGTKADSFGSDLESAKAEFERLYLEKTGNEWDERHNFEKQPHLFHPVEVDYGDDEKSESKVKPGSRSMLPKPVQDLIQMIFDIDQMKQTMKEFEIDLNKMPLGKLSKKHIQDAYSVLTELQGVLEAGKDKTKILDCTNRFFTMIPHDFGLEKPPLLDNTEIVKQKTEMLDSLLEIEVAYALLKGDTGERDPIDVHYEKLRTDLDVLDKSSNQFKMIQEYVKNTHAATHNQYELEVEEVFIVKRHGEFDRFEKFKDLHNRMLLWHGSRTSNFAGILSQGLRIAPPEAPVTGYMFGKGVYFADMVSKSANYCYTNHMNPTGLVLLCEVALGNMQEYTNAHNVTKLPDGKHSVKGVGKTAPNPAGAKTLDNGTVVPMGEGVDTSIRASSLLYNEYIVYDVAQVNIKYLVKMRFKYKF